MYSGTTPNALKNYAKMTLKVTLQEAHKQHRTSWWLRSSGKAGIGSSFRDLPSNAVVCRGTRMANRSRT